MGEDDLPRIKKSLQVVYKSGDLLLHLLNDLLTFSKNQIGQQLSLEEKEFRLSDIKIQIVTIFMKQVKEKNIDFSVRFLGTETEATTDSSFDNKVLPALGPNGTGRLKDMWYVINPLPPTAYLSIERTQLSVKIVFGATNTEFFKLSLTWLATA